MPTTDAPTARLEIISDVVCPWCYIGKHRLEQGLAMLDDDVSIEVSWRPFELNPTLPKEGMDRGKYCEAKFGSIEQARQIYANIAANAEVDGLPIAVERIARTPNTRTAHRLIELAGTRGCQNELVDALFKAYFVDGRDVGDPETLLALSLAAGLSAPEAQQTLADDSGDDAIETQERAASAMGVHGVPAFIYNGRMLFSGAQSAQTIALTLKRAIAKGL